MIREGGKPQRTKNRSQKTWKPGKKGQKRKGEGDYYSCILFLEIAERPAGWS